MPKRRRFPLEQSTDFLLSRAARSMRTTLEQKLEPHGVTAKQWALLVSLDNGDADTPTELARLLDVDVSAVTRLIARLEDKNLLRRQADSSDGRALRLVLSRQGRQMAARLRPHAADVLKTFHCGLSPREIATLHKLLERLLANEPAV